ncbi:hypothetical protein H4582DRAFT_2128066 [Lactarius indigo]|nr:hypothetical protein H4582DRAFT_2128066 [Lactarius indigo]
MAPIAALARCQGGTSNFPRPRHVQNLYSLFSCTPPPNLRPKGYSKRNSALNEGQDGATSLKAGSHVSKDVYQAVYGAANETETLLQNRWSSFQESQSLRAGAIYPSHPLRLVGTVDFSHFSDGRLTAAVAIDKRTALADFELSVERHLDSWVSSHQLDNNAPDVIASCVEQYYFSARGIYNAYPEDNSVMILTITDLWMALDKLTTQQCPLLSSYSPEIPRISFIPYSFIGPVPCDVPCSLKSIFHSGIKALPATMEEKRAELDDLNEKWELLTDAASMMDHDYTEDYEGNLVHGRCEKCRMNYEARMLKIDVFEWPLPQAMTKAQSVIFELAPPRAFSAWREMTYKILCDIGMPNASDNSDQPKLFLDTFSGLRDWAIPADDSDVLLNNGLSFKLYDRKSGSWAARAFHGSTIANLCPPVPVSSPYGKIHSFVCGTRHTSNVVIASQTDCPSELSAHEYLAFSGLRSGPRLQWLNIARELSSPSLSFRREERLGIGPLLDGEREWHTDLDIPSFGRTLLHELKNLLGRIEANWLEEVTIRTIALITSRLLSSTSDPDIRQRAYALLQRARSVAHKWINELDSKLDVTEDEMSRTNLRRRLCTLAATCFSTYDVCPEHVPWTLARDDDIAIAVHCAAIVHNNTPSIFEGDHSRYLIRLLNRHHRLLHFLEPFLHECLESKPSVLTHGGSPVMEGGQKLHYNLLTGKLLIGAKPLGRLPQEIIEHPTYKSVLGARVLDVVPADTPQMEFMTRTNVFGYQQPKRQPPVVAWTEPPNSQTSSWFHAQYSMATSRRLSLINMYTGLTFAPEKLNSALLNLLGPQIPGDGVVPIDLIDIRSPTFETISRQFSALESPKHIIVTRTSHLVEASLSRLGLTFFINRDLELECLSIPGYVIDELQSCGTMFGLRNRLILRPSNESSEVPRRVIIPQGDIEFGLDGDFPNVSIKTGTARRIHWHEYTIDTDLGRLTGNTKQRRCKAIAPDRQLNTKQSILSAPLTLYGHGGNDLPVLSQHHNFHTAVVSILDHGNAMEALYDGPVDFNIRPQDSSLLNRAISRNMAYYPHDLQGSRHSSFSVPEDIAYKSRDVADYVRSEATAYQTSWSVWNGRLCLSRNLWDEMQSWGSLGTAETTPSLRYKDWLSIYDICQEALNCDPQDSKIKLAFSLSAASFSGTDHADIISLIAIFATDTRFRGLKRPSPPYYDLSDGTYLDHARLVNSVSQFALPLELTPAQTMEVRAITDKNATKERRREYNSSISKMVSEAAETIVELWPKIWCDIPSQWFDTQRCKAFVDSYLRSVSRNIDLRDHIHRIQAIIDHYEIITIPPTLHTGFPFGSVDFAVSPIVMMGTEDKSPSSREDSLSCLIHELRQSRKSLLQHYGEDLSKSHSDFLEKAGPLPVHHIIPPQEDLLRYRNSCSKRKDTMFSEISEALAPSQKQEIVASISGLWPRITPRSILRELSRDRVHWLTDQWKLAITRYAIAFLKYQQSQRLLELSSRRRDEELLREVETVCEDVAAACSPDWLLIQINANFLARPLQLAIAREMISPTCQQSASFQLNMGEGKSSVIVPFVAATLADGSNLVRVVTLKPLSNQMFQLLLSKLSDLADRQTDVHDTLLTLHDDRKKRSIAKEFKALQDWMAGVSRDVLDESDEILHVRYQLVYTVGEQMPSKTTQIDGPRRNRSSMFELDQTQNGFPTMRILNQEVSRQISSLIADDALGGALSTLSLAVLSPLIRAATRRFITKKKVSVEDHQLIRSHCSGTTLWSGILLLRGLLVDGEGILGYVLKARRWRVDYGLDPGRTLLAVPYRAKDVPSLRAEFGHPDVAIALTCLSYYYGGLTKLQVLQCFDLLTKLDNPDMEYDQWVEFGEGVPISLRQVNGVNTKDDTQVDEYLVPLFSRNTRVIDFYLSHVVFPRAAKEFPSKLSTSAWDLVEDKTNVTTGFSGTNDNRFLLPTSITQEDPVSQLSTNALVLHYLLQPENNHYECTEGIKGERESAEAFLRRLTRHEPEVRVLLDVGAQMLELQNMELVRHWLSLMPHISAAIYFNESDHLTVLTQDGTIEPLISSPFNRQLDKCIVYLDDVHTRGTDLKLPRETRAAVTLGPKVTKDRLLQGCMRMRQLGKGQSVVFFAPGEVDRRIRGLIPGGQESDKGVCVTDILRWAMHETCWDIGHYLPHWAQQGVDHHRRFSAYKQYNSTGNLDVLKNSWVQRESRTLEEMYEPTSNAQVVGLSPEINGIPSLRERLELLGITRSIDVRMAEEQEREVSHEVERERQAERPPKVYPAKHITHYDLRDFIHTGSLPMSSRYIIPLFSQTGVDKALDSTEEWLPSPLATKDFAITTRCSGVAHLSDYLRPVNWVLSSGSGNDSTAIVISSHEANELLPIIRKSGKVQLHIYAPRVTTSMRSFSDLAFYTIPESPAREWTAPAHLQIKLNLFAGQLYFDSREQYQRVCAKHVEVDGFVPPAYRTGEKSPFSEGNGIRWDGPGSRFRCSSLEQWMKKGEEARVVLRVAVTRPDGLGLCNHSALWGKSGDRALSAVYSAEKRDLNAKKTVATELR